MVVPLLHPRKLDHNNSTTTLLRHCNENKNADPRNNRRAVATKHEASRSRFARTSNMGVYAVSEKQLNAFSKVHGGRLRP